MCEWVISTVQAQHPTICHTGATVFRSQSSPSNSFQDPRSAVQQWSGTPNTHSHTKNDNVCLMLLSAGTHTNLTITQTLALKTVKALFPHWRKSGFHQNSKQSLVWQFRVTLISFCHQLNILTGEPMQLKWAYFMLNSTQGFQILTEHHETFWEIHLFAILQESKCVKKKTPSYLWTEPRQAFPHFKFLCQAKI